MLCLVVIWLGLIEGLQEFNRASSTGHLLLADLFDIAIQAGAMLAPLRSKT